MVSPVQLSCRRYQPRGVSRALPWRVARTRLGSPMVVGVPERVLRVWGGLAGRAMEVLRVHIAIWVVLGGPGWAAQCWMVPWVRDGPPGVMGACGGGFLRWPAFRGALVVSWRPADCDRGRVWGAEQVSGLLGHA